MEEHGRERGATLVEYVLLVAFVAVLATTSIEFIGNAADERYDRTAGGVSGGNWSSPGGPPGGGDGSDDGEGGGGGPTPPPTTNQSPPTTAPPTTTTTTAPSSTASAAAFDSSSWSSGWFQWAGSATFAIVDGAGRPIVGATVEVTITTSGGSTSTVTVTTDANGRAVVELGPYGWYGSWGGTSHADVAVTGVNAPGSTWDSRGPTTRVEVP